MKVVGKIFAVLYTILFTPITLILILVFTISGYFKSSFYTNLINNDALMKTKISDISTDFGGKEEITEICGEDCTVKDAIVASASEGYGIDKELVEEALNDKDIQKAVGDFVGTYISFETTGIAKKLDYKIYEKTLEKEVSQKILNQVGYTKEEFKQLIEEYNENVDDYNNFEGGQESAQKYINY